MNMKYWNKRNHGFTMVEMLAAVAIVVILLAVSAVGVARYQAVLKLTELDNAAREIYMAAENRAVLLSGTRRLSSQLKTAGRETLTDGRGVYYVSKTQMKAELLTVGSIDPTLLEGDFYIVYDGEGGGVTDVFFAEGAGSVETLLNASGGFAAFYQKWAVDRGERLKLKNETLLGWYNGESAQSADIEDDPEEARIEVKIDNGEELTVTVNYTAPSAAQLTVMLEGTDLTALAERKTAERTVGTGPVTYNCTWVLDSLKEGPGKGRFKDLAVSGVAPGGDFTVTATIVPVDGTGFEEASASDTNNSLFQAGSGGETAYIQNLRHLQNLDAGPSGVEGKTAACQTEQVLCTNNETYGNYDFTPIDNTALKKYDGGENEIRGLSVSGTKRAGHAGLFSQTAGGTALQNIRLVNTAVTAPAGYDAGALAGSTGNCTITNCWAYWEQEEAALKDILGGDVDGEDRYNYQINGKNAGGLVGSATGSCTVSQSLAATLVKGTDCAGGLIGSFKGSRAEISISYADCYLRAGEAGAAAGLVGSLAGGGNAELTSCYAAGYILGGAVRAGLCTGSGTTETVNVYSVMSRGSLTGTTYFDLTENHKNDTFRGATCFLGSGTVKDKTGREITGFSYKTMTDKVNGGDSKDFAVTMGGAFAWKDEISSHPYNLREHLTLEIYSFPGLAGLPHYGDWRAEFREPSLVYYEEYSEKTAEDGKTTTTWGVSGGNARDLLRDLKDDKTIRSDGYGVAFLQSDLKGEKVTIKYSYTNSKTGASETETVEVAKNDLTPTVWKNDDGSGEGHYYLVPLPAELMESDREGEEGNHADADFYRRLSFELDLGGGSTVSGKYFYNPHFAETVRPIVAEDTTAQQLHHELRQILIRTPRHLYDLSRFKEYYYDQNRLFQQVLALDYAGYDAYGIHAGTASYAQKPIGDAAFPFQGTYDGGCNAIKNVSFTKDSTASRLYEGLFGHSKGALRNIVYEMNPEETVATDRQGLSSSAYVGALVGNNEGSVRNCAVSGVNLTVRAGGATVYVGGLVGLNEGLVENCAAECAELVVKGTGYAKLYTGGLVGCNSRNRSISTSYAVGRVTADVDDTINTALVCGFAGQNTGGVISYSYAAADLETSGGGGAEVYGFCGVKEGTQNGNLYLDKGNFVYLDAAYVAKYERDGSDIGDTADKAASTVYQDMIAAETAGKLSMQNVWTGSVDPDKEFPYPTGVKDKNGNPCHYGDWPRPMDLGEMGVFYWEKLVDASDSMSNPTYHMSALAVDPDEGTITKRSTLSNAHNDGRVVIEYGYGFYEDTRGQKVSFRTENLKYYTYCDSAGSYDGADGWPDQGDGWKTHYANEEPNADLKKISPISGSLTGSKGAAEALKEQAPEGAHYNFYCWTSFHEGGRPQHVDGDMNINRREGTTWGLNLVGNTEGNRLLGSGTFKLTQGQGQDGCEVTFGVSPLFADALSVKQADKGLTYDAALGNLPGTTAANPFQIRCGSQLQQINWMGRWTDTAVGWGNFAAANYPFLSGNGSEKNYYWEQTHDVDWVAEGNTYQWPKAGWKKGDPAVTGVFMGIAQIQVNGDSVPGWFGGSYDGQNYTLKNLKISQNYSYDPNCMGMFGYTRNATLKNIVMFSETGQDVVTVVGRTNGAAWYAGGVLAGVAANTDIVNCAVAGYTIEDVTVNARSGNSRVGGAIGGLVGMADRELKGCTASTKIIIACNHKNQSDAPIHVGGLVGSTTAAVTGCYTGGQITTDKAQNAKIYAGRIIGGGGTELAVNTGSNVSIKNCYSYLTLPSEGGVVNTVYQIGGGGGLRNPPNVTVQNNYYLADAGTDMADGKQAVTFLQLAGKEPVNKNTNTFILEGLNGGKGRTEPYDWVTTKVGALSVSGRFSFVPQNRNDLQGLDYPFPTVLKMDGYNVHYGAWGISGILRANGGTPVELDMFVNRTHEEQLELSGDLKGKDGTWSVTADKNEQGEEVVTASISDGLLTLTGVKESDPVTVTVTYGVGAMEYSLSIRVYVRAEVSLAPGSVDIFPNDTLTLPLTANKKDGTPFGSGGGDGGKVAVTSVTGQTDPVTAAVPEDDASGIRLTRGEGKPVDRMWLTAVYSFTYPTADGYTKEGASHNLEVRLVDIPEGKWDDKGENWSIDFGAIAGAEVKSAELAWEGAAEAGFKEPKVTGKTKVTLTVPMIEDPENPDDPPEKAEVPEDAKLKVTLTTADGATHELTIAVPAPPPADEGGAEGEPARAANGPSEDDGPGAEPAPAAGEPSEEDGPAAEPARAAAGNPAAAEPPRPVEAPGPDEEAED